MQFPIVLHKDKNSDYGATVPDLPGCFSAGQSVDEALAMAKEAIELYLEQTIEDGKPVPLPGRIEQHQRNSDYRGGVWAFVSVDESTLRVSANRVTLGKFLDAYIERRSDVKPNTKQLFGHVRTNLIDVFGADRPLDSLNAGDADDFRRALQRQGEPSDSKAAPKSRKKRKLGPVTIARRCSMVRTFFRDAVKRKLIDANPLEDIGGGPKSNPARQRFIDQSTIEKVIAACLDAEWRLLVALSRFGGLRIPSEACLLRQSDVDWSESRLLIHSPKTEHHSGKGTRAVTIFGELRPYLDELFNIVTNGFEQPVNPDAWVLAGLHRQAATVGDWKRVNLRTRFAKIIKRAGCDPWPRLWHNLRATRQTELTEVFPAHFVSAHSGALYACK